MRQVDENYSPLQLEKDIRTLWERTRIYEKVKRAGESGKAYYFLDGPPYTTGSIHIGTAWNKILKDSILRYHRMNGRHVIDRAGYDMHGLPIEVKVEQALGFESKKDIEKYGMRKFMEQCREFAIKNKVLMDDQFANLGVWLDFPGAYQTSDGHKVPVNSARKATLPKPWTQPRQADRRFRRGHDTRRLQGLRDHAGPLPLSPIPAGGLTAEPAEGR